MPRCSPTLIVAMAMSLVVHFFATGITSAMAIKNAGRGSQNTIAHLDADGRSLDESKTYKIHLLPKVPARDFWSFTLYDNQTRSMLQTDLRFPGIDNNQKGLQRNADGSFGIYFSPQPPTRVEHNWIPTVPGKGWNTDSGFTARWKRSPTKPRSRAIRHSSSSSFFVDRCP